MENTESSWDKKELSTSSRKLLSTRPKRELGRVIAPIITEENIVIFQFFDKDGD